MQTDTLPPPRNPEHQLQDDIRLQVTEALRGMLPPPIVDTDEAWARRDRTALAVVHSLNPASPVEVVLATHHVAALAHAAECLNQLGQVIADPKVAAKLRAQHASMGREARGYLTKLQSVQKLRRQCEDNDTERQSAALTGHCTLGLMTEALEKLPARPPQRQMVAPPPPEPAAAAPAKRPMAPPPRDYDEWSDEEKHVNLVRWQADRYAIQHTLRVQLIRKLGGLPPNCDFEPPPPEVLEYIIHADSENMRWADGYEPWKPKQPK